MYSIYLLCVNVYNTLNTLIGTDGPSAHKDGYEYTTILVALFGAMLAGSIVLGSCLILCKYTMCSFTKTAQFTTFVETCRFSQI